MKKRLRNLLKGASLTGALFVFQACYGTYMAPLYEEGGLAPMSFSLVSRSTGAPLEGIRILGGEYKGAQSELGVTGADGKCAVKIPYRRNMEGPFLYFEDPSGLHAVKDTSLADLREREILITLTPVL